MRNKTICVIGSGNGAFAVAGCLALEGRQVILWDCEDFRENLEAVRSNGNRIRVTGAALVGEGQLYKVTEDLGNAMEEADITLIIIPSFALRDTARRICRVAKPGMKVFLCAGSTGGALEFAKLIQDAGLEGTRVGEYCTLPFGCKKTGPASVNVATRLTFNQFAAFPARDSDELFRDAADLFPETQPAKDVMECSLNNGNIILHGPIMLMNAAGTEGNPDNHHYRDGITPSVARVMDAMDEERMAVCRALGYTPLSTAQAAVRKGYCPRLEVDSYRTFRGSGDFMTSPGPTTLEHRYMTEDIPYTAAVVPVFGRILGVPTPLIEAMVTLCGALMGTDYWGSGRTAEALGVAGMDRETLLEYLQNGKQPVSGSK